MNVTNPKSFVFNFWGPLQSANVGLFKIKLLKPNNLLNEYIISIKMFNTIIILNVQLKTIASTKS